MAGYPIQLEIQDMPCIVAGGGSVAYRKVKTLLQAGACVTVVSPALCSGLEKLTTDGAVRYLARGCKPCDVIGYRLVICATDDSHLNRQLAQEAKRSCALVNVIDEPKEGNFTVPSQVWAGSLGLTVSTGGISPAFARMMRMELEETYGKVHGAFLARLGAHREEVKNLLPSPSEREAFWRSVLSRDVMQLLHEGKKEEAEELVENAISSIRTQS